VHGLPWKIDCCLDGHEILTFRNPKFHYYIHKSLPLDPSPLLWPCQRIHLSPLWHFVMCHFLWWGLLVPHSTQKLETHLLLAVFNYFLSIFTATFHVWRPSSPSATCRCGDGYRVLGCYFQLYWKSEPWILTLNNDLSWVFSL